MICVFHIMFTQFTTIIFIVFRLLFEVVGGLNFHGIKLEGSSKGLIQDSGVQERESARDKCGWEKRERRRKQSGVVEGLDREPYTCERLSTIRGGYRQLSSTFAALSIDFTNPLVSIYTITS